MQQKHCLSSFVRYLAEHMSIRGLSVRAFFCHSFALKTTRVYLVCFERVACANFVFRSKLGSWSFWKGERWGTRWKRSGLVHCARSETVWSKRLSRVASLAFLKPDFLILGFFDVLGLFLPPFFLSTFFYLDQNNFPCIILWTSPSDDFSHFLHNLIIKCLGLFPLLDYNLMRSECSYSWLCCFSVSPPCVVGAYQLTIALHCAMTNHICVIALFEYTCDMDHETDAKIKIKPNSFFQKYRKAIQNLAF